MNNKDCNMISVRQVVVNPKEAAELIAVLTKENDRLRSALKQISDEDYRGPRPNSAVIAFKALNQ